MKKIMFTFAFLCIFLFTAESGCGSDSNSELAQKQEQIMQEANRQVGMPAIDHFTERKMMKMILELRDNPKLINYAYIVSELNGKPVFLGKCIGFGLPYSTQYTNPQVREVGPIVLPQADPNGLFSPASADGTWLLLINPKTGEPCVTYVEPRILISQFPLGE